METIIAGETTVELPIPDYYAIVPDLTKNNEEDLMNLPEIACTLFMKIVEMYNEKSYCEFINADLIKTYKTPTIVSNCISELYKNGYITDGSWISSSKKRYTLYK